MEKNKEHSKNDNYTSFILMLVASFIAMYITMYLNATLWTTFILA